MEPLVILAIVALGAIILMASHMAYAWYRDRQVRVEP